MPSMNFILINVSLFNGFVFLHFFFCILFCLIDPFDTYCFLAFWWISQLPGIFFSMACISSSIASIFSYVIAVLNWDNSIKFAPAQV